MREAGFSDIDIQANTKMLHLPAPKDFLWQYVHSTPLAAEVSKADEQSRISLENSVVDKWQDYAENGVMKHSLRIVTASARN